MRLFHTDRGLARLDGDELAVLDVDHLSLVDLLADTDGDIASTKVRERVDYDAVALLAPTAQPGTVVIVGYNYRAHIAEIGVAVPTAPPLIAIAAPAGVTAAWNADIVVPAEATDEVDYEGEVGVIIGRTAHQVAAADAWSVIAGLTVVNDVSARDVQRRAMETRDATLRMGKLFPTFKPCGPGLVTAEEFAGTDFDLELTTIVNGEQRQHARTSDLLFSIPELIEAITRTTTLQPGDLICTGTPGGVGLATGNFLRPGDVVEVRVDGIGALRNTVRDSAGS